MAQAIVEALPPSALVAKAEVATNGFINFFLAPVALAQEVRRIHEIGPPEQLFGAPKTAELKQFLSSIND